MEAYDQQDKQKGLFTFYREQAEQQDKIKLHKKQQLAKMRQLPPQPQHNTPIHPEQSVNKNGGKVGDKTNKKQQQQKKQTQKQQPKPETDIIHKQFQKRLLEILQKHKYDRNQRRNLKVVMKFGKNEDVALKYHMQALMQQQHEFNKLQNGQKNKNELFAHKKMGLFERVALCPTNFEVELDDNIPNYSKNIGNRRINNASTAIPKRLNKLQEDSRSKQDQYRIASQILQRNMLLPKIYIKNNLSSSNSVNISKKKHYQSARDRTDRSVIGSVPLYNLNKIKSIKDESLYIDNDRYKNASKMNQHIDNRIYPIFIQTHQAKKYQQEAKEDKQKMFVQIIRKLKFK